MWFSIQQSRNCGTRLRFCVVFFACRSVEISEAGVSGRSDQGRLEVASHASIRMKVSGIVLAALTIVIGTPVVSGARPDRAVRAGPPGAEVASPNPAPIELVVEVRDLARVPPGIMRDTKAEVAQTFLAVGVRIVWAEHGRTPHNVPSPVRLFVVGSSPHTVPSGEDPLAATLGVAPESGEWAQVFYGRVAAAVAPRQVSIDVVLAHVIAHELGHVLLPPDSHSAVGVMRHAVDLTHPAFRRFTNEQARLIRAALASGRRYAWSCNP